jgi:MFS family permease
MWLVFIMFFCFGYSLMGMTVHLVPHIINLNISPATAALVMATIGGVNIAGRLAFGGIGDKIGSLLTYACGFIVIAVSVFWLLFIRDIWMLYLFAVVWGFSSGGMASVQPSIVAECFGLKYIGSIFGICGLGNMVGGSVSPVVTGLIFDLTGSYQTAFLICGLFALAGFAISRVLVLCKSGAAEGLITLI